MSKCILGIDIGTTNVKSVLFALDGSILTQESAEYPTFFQNRGGQSKMPSNGGKGR